MVFTIRINQYTGGVKVKSPLVDFELKSLNEMSDIYSLKINGKEIGHIVKEIHLDLKAHALPTITLTLNAEKISINSRALLEIPEPYINFIKKE